MHPNVLNQRRLTAAAPQRQGGVMLRVLLVLGGLVLLVEAIGATMEPSMTAEADLEVNAPPAAIYRAASDLRAWERWFGRGFRSSGGRIVHQLGDSSRGVGAQLEMLFGDKAHVLVEIEEARQNERLILRTRSGPLAVDLTDPDSVRSIGARDVLEFSGPSSGPTRVVWRRIGDPVGARWVRVLDRVALKKRVLAQLNADLESLTSFASDSDTPLFWAELDEAAPEVSDLDGSPSEDSSSETSGSASQASGNPASK